MEEKEITEIEQDLTIDKDNLDGECIDQPRKFMKWASKYAESVRSRDEAKRRVSVTRSNISLDIRSRPDAYGLEKTTEASVSAAMESTTEVVDAEKELSDAQYAVNIFGASREAFDQRKSMLERLVSLYLSGYYSQPKLSTEEVGKMADIGTEHQKELLRKRRNK